MPAKLPKFTVTHEPPRQDDTLVIVPVYNEMPHLPKVIQSITETWKGDILAIDDNSQDGSTEVLQQTEGVGVIRNHRNAGAGGVLLQGFAYARSRGFHYAITLDADGQHSPFCIADFLRAIRPRCCRRGCWKTYDMVWGSRYTRGYPKLAKGFALRQEVNKTITRRLNEVTGYTLTDAFCGFRAYNLAALERLDLTEMGYGMFMQMTVQAARAGLRIQEIPVPLIYLDETRDFQGIFQDTQKRLAYYNRVIDQELVS